MATDTAPPRRSRRGSGAVTLHDVAKLAGVAPITASRALNTPDQVSAEVLQKVSDAVARTGYVPNLLAGGLASTRSRLVAAVVPTISGPVFLGTVQSLTEALAERGYQLMLGQAGYAGDARGRAARSHHRPPAGRHRAHRHHALGPGAQAAAGQRHPGGGNLGSDADADRHAGRLLARGSGPRRGCIPARQGPAPAGRGGRRRRARQAPHRGLSLGGAARWGWPRCAWSGAGADHAARSGREALAELLRERGDIDAVFCSSDLLALGVLTEARVRGCGCRSNWPWWASATWTSPPTWTRR